MDSRQAAVTALGAQMRRLVDAVVGTQVDTAALRSVTEEAARLAEVLSGPGSAEVGWVDRFRLYNPVVGTGSPVAPPLEFTTDGEDIVGTCTLGLAYQGPPGCAHGGISALLLDQALGQAVGAAGHAGVTGELSIRYHAPVPLHTPVVIRGRVTAMEGRKISAHGTLCLADQPTEALVTATGLFLALTRAQLLHRADT